MTSLAAPYPAPVILLSAVLTMFLGSSFISASGVLHIALLEHYKQSVTATAWIGALFPACFCLGGPVAGAIIQRYSCRVCIVAGGVCNFVGFVLSAVCNNFYALFVTFGICAGAGHSLAYTGAFVAVGYNFESKRSMATGVLVSGFALGQMVHPVLVQALLDQYGLNGCFLLIGAIGFQTCVFGLLVLPNKTETHIKSKLSTFGSESNFFGALRNALKLLYLNKPFVFFCISTFSSCIGFSLTFIYVTDFYHHSGSDKLEASILTSFIGVGSFLSRILIGLATGNGGLDAKLIYLGQFGILSVLTALITEYAVNFYAKLIYSLFCGLYSGATWTLLSPITVEIVGISNLALAFGIEMHVSGLAFLVAPVLGGLIIEQYFSYSLLFKLVGLAYALASVFGVLTSLHVPKQTGSSSQEADDICEISPRSVAKEELALVNNDDDENKFSEMCRVYEATNRLG